MVLYQNHRAFLVREAGLEPARPEWTLEPESSESANSTTRAYWSSFPVPEEKLVRVMGLEPTRPIEHKHLKLACLPIPAHSQMSLSTEDLLIIAYGEKKSRAFSAKIHLF